MEPDEMPSNPEGTQAEGQALGPDAGQAGIADNPASATSETPSAAAQPLEERPATSPATSAVRGRLSDEKIDELIALLKEILADKESSPTPPSADKLQGVVLQVVKAADAQSGESPQAPPAAVGDRTEARDPPRAEHVWPGVEKFAGGQFARPEARSDASTRADRADVLPRIIVTVELANARAIVQEDRRETADEMAKMLGEIAASQVQRGFFYYDAERRF